MEKEFVVVDKSDVENKYDTESEAALKNGGWNYRKFADISDYDIDKRRGVTVFKSEVSEFGTYEVTVSVRTYGEDRDISLFAGRRNLIDGNIRLSEGEVYTKVFYQAVMPYIPALSSKRCNDKYIFVSMAGFSPEEVDKPEGIQVSISAVRKDVPVIWIAGDSTLTDQNAGIPYYPYGSCAGWAQMLTRYTDRVAVCNLAHSGMTTNCFRDDGHYAIALEYMKEGDIFIIQFGHNDQKRRNLAARGGYAHNLERFALEVRIKGATPVICSPISRIPLELSEADAKELSMPAFYSLLQEYADAARDVAREQDILFVDLHDKAMKKWIELSKEAGDYFIKGDITHTNEYGALMIADMFVKEVGNALPGLEYRELQVMTPGQDTKDIPKELPLKSPFEIEPPYLDISNIPEYEGIRKAFKYGLLDPCVMYLHPYDPMPRGQLLMVMFNAFKMPGTRPYKKKYKDVKVDEWISGYVQTLINEGFLDEEEGEKTLFRPDDALTFGELSKFIIKRYEKAAYLSQEDCLERAKALGVIKIMSAKAEDVVCRADVYIILADCMDYAKEEKTPGSVRLASDADVHPVH